MAIVWTPDRGTATQEAFESYTRFKKKTEDSSRQHGDVKFALVHSQSPFPNQLVCGITTTEAPVV